MFGRCMRIDQVGSSQRCVRALQRSTEEIWVIYICICSRVNIRRSPARRLDMRLLQAHLAALALAGFTLAAANPTFMDPVTVTNVLNAFVANSADPEGKFPAGQSGGCTPDEISFLQDAFDDANSQAAAAVSALQQPVGTEPQVDNLFSALWGLADGNGGRSLLTRQQIIGIRHLRYDKY